MSGLRQPQQHISLALLASVLALSTKTVAGYSWSFAAAPQQCSDLTVNVNGGTPPYRILLVPTGASPLGNVEARKIVDQPFSGNDNKVTFKLNFPTNSQFVAVVSDATGFGSGGTTAATTVTGSSDSSCFDSSKSVSPDFTFSVEPPNQIVQCTKTRIWWDPATVQGNPNFLGVIPGGISFAIPQNGAATTVPQQGTGFDWTPNVRGGNTLIVIGGDSRGNGTAGSFLTTVSSGTTSDNTGCLDNSSPSSTAGSPAGGVQTGSSSSGGGGGGGGGGQSSQSGGNDDSKGSNTGAIVGGVVGGIVAIIALVLVLLFFRRRARLQKKQKERPVDLLNYSDEGDEGPGEHNRLPQYYEPEPFVVPDPTVGSSSADGHTRASNDWARSQALSSSRSGTPDLLGAGGVTPSSTSGPRKTPMKQLRPVNIMQHEDAGPSEAPHDPNADETIELPPAYTNLKTSSGPPSPAVSGGPSAATSGGEGTSTGTHTASS